MSGLQGSWTMQHMPRLTLRRDDTKQWHDDKSGLSLLRQLLPTAATMTIHKTYFCCFPGDRNHCIGDVIRVTDSSTLPRNQMLSVFTILHRASRHLHI